MRTLFVAFFVGALTIAVFWPASRGGFAWDDANLITTRHDTLDEWSDVPAAFGRAATAGEGVAYYRPIMIASFVVDAKLFGFEAPVFHRTNVLWHGVNVALVVLVLVAYGCRLWAAAIAALLFGLHPLQCQAVALILGRNDVQLVTTVALMLVADEVVRRRRPRLADALVALGFALTLWTKETGIVAPIFLVLLDVLWRGKPWRALRSRVPLAVALGVIVVLYFATRVAVIGAVLDTGHYGYVPPLERPALAAAIFGYYVRHVFLPWGAAPAPYHPGLVDPSKPDLWIAVGFVVAFVVGTTLAWRRDRRVAAGLAIFAIGLFPVLALAAPMKVQILDHRTYLSFLGLAFSVGAWRALGDTVAGRCVAGVGLGILALLTFLRLPSYGDALSLWTLGVETAPSSDYARNNYGAALMDADRFPEAVDQFREGLRLNPSYDKARYNLLNCLEYLGDRTQALRELEVLVEQRPKDAALLTRLATMRNSRGRPRGRTSGVREGRRAQARRSDGAAQSRRRARAARRGRGGGTAAPALDRARSAESGLPGLARSRARRLGPTGRGRRRLRALARRGPRQRPGALAARASALASRTMEGSGGGGRAGTRARFRRSSSHAASRRGGRRGPVARPAALRSPQRRSADVAEAAQALELLRGERHGIPGRGVRGAEAFEPYPEIGDDVGSRRRDVGLLVRVDAEIEERDPAARAIEMQRVLAMPHGPDRVRLRIVVVGLAREIALPSSTPPPRQVGARSAPSSPAGTGAPTAVRIVGNTSTSDAVVATRTPRGTPAPRRISGTRTSSWYCVRPWSTPPCSRNSSPWSRHDQHEQPGSSPKPSRRRASSSSICRMPAS